MKKIFTALYFTKFNSKLYKLSINFSFNMIKYYFLIKIEKNFNIKLII